MGKERQTRGRMAISLGIKYEAATHGQIHLVRVLASTGLRAPIGPRKAEYPTWDAGSLFIVVLQRWGVALPTLMRFCRAMKVKPAPSSSRTPSISRRIALSRSRSLYTPVRQQIEKVWVAKDDVGSYASIT